MVWQILAVILGLFLAVRPWPSPKLTRLRGWACEVPLFNANNGLQKGAGVQVPLSAKRYFRRCPHLKPQTAPARCALATPNHAKDATERPFHLCRFVAFVREQ
jgi:hypothetical protein